MFVQILHMHRDRPVRGRPHNNRIKDNDRFVLQ